VDQSDTYKPREILSGKFTPSGVVGRDGKARTIVESISTFPLYLNTQYRIQVLLNNGGKKVYVDRFEVLLDRIVTIKIRQSELNSAPEDALILDLRPVGQSHRLGYWTWDGAKNLYTIDTDMEVIVTSGGQQVDKAVETRFPGLTGNAAYNITLRDVQSAPNTGSPFYAKKTVNLTLEGTNTLTGAPGEAGLTVAEKAPNELYPNILIIGGTGTLYANGGNNSGGSGGAGIGAGISATWPGVTTINSGMIYATGGDGTAGGTGIGGRGGSPGGTITISGGTVIAKGGNKVGGKDDEGGGAGIGVGPGNGYATASGSSITISGGTVQATGGNGSNSANGAKNGGAGIGAGGIAPGCPITISGGTVTATGGSGAPGIGGGYMGDCDTIIISGGRVEAAGDDYSPGIGSGGYCDEWANWTGGKVIGNITISSPAAGWAHGGARTYRDIGRGYSKKGYLGITEGLGLRVGTISVTPGFSGSVDN
jgi:hypothetical protein